MAQEALYELTVVGGKDSGKVIPLEGPNITLGRSAGAFQVTPGSIQFEEPSVARVHAILSWNAEENVYHFSNRSPISPVVVNGKPAASGRLVPGVQVKMGGLVLEISALGGTTPAVSEPLLVSAVPAESGYLGEVQDVDKGRPPAWLVPMSAPGQARPQAPVDTGKKGKKRKEAEEEQSSPAADAPAPQAPAAPAAPAPPVPEMPAPAPAMPAKPLGGTIEVVKGQVKGRSFKVTGPTTIGRSPDCTISLPDSQVSRRHCSIELEEGLFILVHESSTSTTKVGRTVIKDRRVLQGDEEITLADRVILRWKRS